MFPFLGAACICIADWPLDRLLRTAVIVLSQMLQLKGLCAGFSQDEQSTPLSLQAPPSDKLPPASIRLALGIGIPPQ